LTWVQKLAAIVPLLMSLLGWGSTTYLDAITIKAHAKKEKGDLKIMVDLAKQAGRCQK